MTCNRPNTSQDFCTHSNSHSALGLFLPARAKRGSAETAAGAVRATRTSSRMLKSISSAVSAHPLHKTTATCHKTTATCHKTTATCHKTTATCHKTCVRHAKACSSHQKKHVNTQRTKRSKLFTETGCMNTKTNRQISFFSPCRQYCRKKTKIILKITFEVRLTAFFSAERRPAH